MTQRGITHQTKWTLCGVKDHVRRRTADVGLMEPELALAIADMRLLQTVRLLERLAKNHARSESLRDAVESVYAARHLVTTLAAEAC